LPVGRDYLQYQLTIIKQYPLSGFDLLWKILIANVHALSGSGTFLCGKYDFLTGLQQYFLGFYVAYPDLGTLQVSQDTYVEIMLLIDPQYMVDDFLVFFVGTVGKIEPEYVNAFFGEGQEHLITGAGGAYRGHNLGILMHFRLCI